MAGIMSFLVALWGIFLVPGLGMLIAGKIAKKRRLTLAGWIVSGVFLALIAITFVCAMFLIE